MICGGENCASGCHLAVLSIDAAFNYHYMAAHPLPSHPIGVLVVLAIPVKLSKILGIHLAIHAIVGEKIDYK